MAQNDRHSRIVGWLKLVLPLGALVLLSTLFLLADRIDPSAAIPYAEVDVEALARDPRMTAPSYAGLTSDGASLTMTAEAARPASASQNAAAEAVDLRLVMPGGGSSQITARNAALDQATQRLQLSGGVTVNNSAGYVVKAEALTAALDRSKLQSEAEVVATGPQITLDAGRFTLEKNQAAEGYLLVFSGGVKLLYQPGP